MALLESNVPGTGFALDAVIDALESILSVHSAKHGTHAHMRTQKILILTPRENLAPIL